MKRPATVVANASCFRVVLCGVVVASAIACENVVVPFPSGATQFAPRPEYALWWRTIEQCSGRRASMASIAWFSVPGSTFVLGGDSSVDGAFFPSSNRIVLAERSIDYGGTVRHEMLHALDGRHGHPADMFRVRCGGYVDCAEPCATEVGSFPDPPATSPEITPGSLSVSVAVEPAVITDSTDGWAVVTVSATNPNTYPVWVSLVMSAPGYAPTFGFGMGNLYPFGSMGATEVIDRGRIGFSANETKRFAFDARLIPGDFTIQAWGIFNSDTTPRITVTRH